MDDIFIFEEIKKFKVVEFKVCLLLFGLYILGKVEDNLFKFVIF